MNSDCVSKSHVATAAVTLLVEEPSRRACRSRSSGPCDFISCVKGLVQGVECRAAAGSKGPAQEPTGHSVLLQEILANHTSSMRMPLFETLHVHSERGGAGAGGRAAADG
jgi:hypothetical protein